MSNNSLDKNTFTDNNVNNSNKSNLKISQNGSLSDQLIFFKEDVLKDIKQLESKIFLKYDIQHNINSNKINKVESLIEQINQRVTYLSTSITTDATMKETIEKLSAWNTKLEESLVLQDVRIKNVTTKLTETIDKFDKILSETVIYPMIIGSKARFKTFHELIDFVLFNLNTLLMFKEKMNIDFKDYKYKTDSMLTNFQVKLDYLTKNANAFTCSSIRASEKKMEQTFYGHIEKLVDFESQFHEFKDKFDSFTDIQEEKILSVIESSKKIQNLGKIDEILLKIEDLENKIESLKEMRENEIKNNEKEKSPLISNTNSNNDNNTNQNNNNTIINKDNKEKLNLSSNNNHTINANERITSIKSLKGESSINNEFNVKNATSILKDYINGRISENEIYRRRKSVNCSSHNEIPNIKENNNNSNIKNSFSPIKRQLVQKRNKNLSNGKYESLRNSIRKSEYGEEEEEEDEQKDSDSNSYTLRAEINNIDKNNEYQKLIYKLDGNEKEINLMKKEQKKNKKKNNRNEADNSIIKYTNLSKQLINNGRNSIHNSISNNSDIENQGKNSTNDFKIDDNYNNLNLLISNNMPLTNKIANNNRTKIILKSLEGSKNKESNLSLFEKTKKYENIKDVKTIITIIKKESRESLIPVIPPNKVSEKAPNKIVNENNKTGSIKTNDKAPNKLINDTIKSATIKVYDKTPNKKINENIKTGIIKINDKAPNKLINENIKNKTIKTNDKTYNKIINDNIKINPNKLNNLSSINNINNINNISNISNFNNMNNRNSITLNSRNKIIKIESDTNNNNLNFSKTKIDFTKIKLQSSNTPNKIMNQKNTINSNNLNLPNPPVKKLNKATSAERLTLKNKTSNTYKIDISFKPYAENNKEKDEQKMKKIFNQMKDFLPSDEKALIKERFSKYGYDKEKIFINEQKEKNGLDVMNINNNNIFSLNRNNSNFRLPKNIK